MSQPQTKVTNGTTYTEKLNLSVLPEQVGSFIGHKGFSLRKFVIVKSRNALFREEEEAGHQDTTSSFWDHPNVAEYPLPFVKIEVHNFPHDDIQNVVAIITAPSERLLEISVENIKIHQDNFIRPDQPSRPKICRLVFKTNLPHDLIGKYIGSQGKNCKMLASHLEKQTEKLKATSFRVSIKDSDGIKDPKKFSFIKNKSTSSQDIVFITVTAMFSGNPRDLLSAIKTFIIESVVSIEEYTPDAVKLGQLAAENFLVTNINMFAPDDTQPEESIAKSEEEEAAEYVPDEIKETESYGGKEGEYIDGWFD
jgi:hypothetical protein